MNGWVLPEQLLREAPAYTPGVQELADLELLLNGALDPLTGFHTRADLAAIATTGQLADGTPWPVPVTLDVPASLLDGLDLANPLGRVLVLTDQEGAPLAAVDVIDIWPVRPNWCGVGGPVRRIGTHGHGSFRQLRLSPSQVTAALPAGRVLGVWADGPLHRPQLAQLAYAARTIAGHVLILIPTGGPHPHGIPTEALIRTIFAARERMPASTIVVVPIARRSDEISDALLRARVAATYGATHMLAGRSELSGGGPRALLPRELAYDGRDGQWRGADDIPPRHRRAPMTEEEIDALLDRGIPLPEWHTPPAVARELAKARPPRRLRGVVLFFTGLSGSGKSTIARGVADELAETGERTITLIDGDVARRFLTAGLGFSKTDRDHNVRRIGFVAAEAARHGGLALCCPIAPYAEARNTARELALTAGAGFLLVHVSTSLDVCEQRDRKGLYARARNGTITGMTGIDDPYEAPTDADLVIDTASLSIDDAVATVIDYLVDEGWLDRP